MKKIFCFSALLFLCIRTVCQEPVVFQGTVKCYIQDDQRATKGANNVIVVPGFIPSKTGITGQQGYYELNTAVPLSKLDGKYVMLYYVSACKLCEQKRNVFVSEDQVRSSGKNLSYVPIPTIQMAASCRQTELKPLTSDSIYNSFAKLPAQDLDKISPLNAVTATPGVLNVLTNIITAPVIINAGTFIADTAGLAPGKFPYGNFLLASPMLLTANMGFNFAPNRDLSEAVFWNPAAMANSKGNAGVSLFTNVKNNGKLTGFIRLTDRIVIGAGGIYTQQDNFRTTRFRQVGNNSNTVSPLHFQELKEYAAYLSPSFKINRISVGASIKSIWQRFNIPQRMEITQNPDANTFFDSTVSEQKFDADLSVSYNTRSFKAGINVMNIAGTELFADAFPAGKKQVPVKNIRSFGAGLCYKWKQFNLGTDVLFTEEDLYDVTVGVNYIPLNNMLLSGGYAFKQQAFSFSFRMKYFRLTYINDNGLMVNEEKEGKANILNGQLYSGLIFIF